MNDKILLKICILLIIIGLISFVFFYEEEYKESSISAALENEGIKGKFFGRIDFVIKNEPSTIFTLTNDAQINVFYPGESELAKNDFVWVYGESQLYNGKMEIVAQKVVKD